MASRGTNSNCLTSANVECHVQHQILPNDVHLAILAPMVPELQSWHYRKGLQTIIRAQSNHWCTHLPRDLSISNNVHMRALPISRIQA